MIALLLLLAACAPQEVASKGEAQRAVAEPVYWTGGATAELRRGDQTWATLKTRSGYLPNSALSRDQTNLATVALPPGEAGHPHRARLVEGSPAGPWLLRHEDALRLQRPVYGPELHWIRLDAPVGDGPMALSAMKEDVVHWSGSASWLQWIPGAPPTLYMLDAEGEATLQGGHDLALGRGQARNFVADGRALWLHWQPAVGEAVLRRIEAEALEETPAPGFGARSFVIVDGRPIWSEGGRHPERATELGVLWRGPGARWTLGEAPLAEGGVSWVGTSR